MKQEQIFEVAEIILEQLQESRVNGFPFFAYMGIKKYVLMENELLLRMPADSKFNKVEVVYDVGQDLYNIIFFIQSVLVKRVDGVTFDVMAEIIAREAGVL